METRNENEEEPIASFSNANGRITTNQEIDSLSGFSSKNVTYDIYTFPYVESKSMSGIFFFDKSGNPAFNFMRPYPHLNLPTPFFFNIPTPFTFLSSSQGLLLCRDFVDYNYHICNPFIQSSSSYQLVPPPPSSLRSTLCPSVLSTDLRSPGHLHFYITCIEEHETRFCNSYTFAMYSSYEGEWFPGIQPIKTDAPVIGNTGVSSADGSVYWLTEAPHQIVKYSMNGELGGDYSQVFDLPAGCSGNHVKLQLGRMGSVGISLVALKYNEIALFLLRDGYTDSYSWAFLCCLDVSSIFLPEKIELLRFEMEVALWVGDRIVFWTPLLPFRKMFNLMPEWISVPIYVCETIPCVHTNFIPLDFVKSCSAVAAVDSDDDEEDEVYSNGCIPFISANCQGCSST